MLHNILLLTKILLANTGGLFQIKFRKVNAKITTAIFWVLMGLCFLPLMAMLYSAFSSMYQLFSSLGQVDYLTATVLNLMATIVFFFSLFTIPAIFYFSKDIDSLLPLPLRDVEIIAAKFLVSMVYEYALLALFLLPFFAVMVQHVNPAVFIPAAFVTFILLPVFPLCYSSAIIMVLMSFSRFSKNKEAYHFIAGIMAIGIGISASFISQRLASVDSGQIMLAIQQNESLLNKLSSFFPVNRFFATTLANGYLPGLLSCLALPCAAFSIFLLIARLFYFKGVMGVTDSRRTAKKLTAGSIADLSRLQSPLVACIKKELKLLFRSPTLFMNCVLMNFIFPALIVVPIYFSSQEIFDYLDTLDLSTGSAAAITLVIAAAVGILMGTMNLISATAISREGSGYIYMKYIPLHYRTQINAKVFAALLLGNLGSALTIGTAFIILPIPLFVFLGGLVLALLGSVFINYLGILLDLAYPKLNWDNEQQAVKQNLNTMIIILASFAMIAVMVIPSMIFLKTPLAAFATLFVILMLVNYGTYKQVMRLGIRLMAQL